MLQKKIPSAKLCSSDISNLFLNSWPLPVLWLVLNCRKQVHCNIEYSNLLNHWKSVLFQQNITPEMPFICFNNWLLPVLKPAIHLTENSTHVVKKKTFLKSFASITAMPYLVFKTVYHYPVCLLCVTINIQFCIAGSW